MKSSQRSVQFSENNDFFEISQQSWTLQLEDKQPIYRNPAERSAMSVAPPSTLSRPNYEGNISRDCSFDFLAANFIYADILRRVSIVMHQHILKCENRLTAVTPDTKESGLFYMSRMEEFEERNFLSPQYVYHFIRAPICRLGMLYGIKQYEPPAKIPSSTDIHVFLRELFLRAQLSAECSIGK
jgi:hypothetical protein